MTLTAKDGACWPRDSSPTKYALWSCGTASLRGGRFIPLTRNKFVPCQFFLIRETKVLNLTEVRSKHEKSSEQPKRPVDRRSFMKSGFLLGGAVAVGAGLLTNGTPARAQERGRLNPGLPDKFAGTVATIASFTADGLFNGQSRKFLNTLHPIAVEADSAVRLAL
jgi:hypothetical protein